ncbi:MAG TPA: amidohydrolase family protein, partial [Bryobacteraceae bacterium]
MSRLTRIIGAILLLCGTLPSQAPQAVDLIWSARYVVTEDPQRRVIEDGAVAIRGQVIVDVGTIAEMQQKYSARNLMDQPNAILAPGLINTHTHAAMSLFRGVANDLKLQDWLEKFIFPAEAKNVDREFVRWGTRLGLLEMALSGTTTFADMYYFEETVAEETKRAGMRGMLGQTVIGFPAPDYKTPEAALVGAEAFLKMYPDDPLIVPAVAPHAIYTTSDDTLQAARTLADRYGKPLIIHLAETKTEFDEAVQKRKKTPTAALNDLGVLQGWTLAAHAVWLDPADFGLLRAAGTGIAHCPSSNMMLASGVAPVLKMLRAGIPVGLGTDGVAGSNNDHDMMEEMDLAAKLQKVTAGDPSALTANQAFDMATIQGAQALRMDKLIGSLEAGKRADIISVRLDVANAAPLYNVYSQLVYSLKAADVSDVMVNGRIIVRSRRMLTIDDKAVLAKA